MEKTGDLTREEQMKVIAAAFIALGTILAGAIILVQFVFDRSQVDRLWASGMSFFGIAKTFLPSFYLFMCLPSTVSVSVTLACLRRRFSDLAICPLLLLSMGVFFFLAYLFLSLFDVFLGNLWVGLQALFILPAFLVPGIILTLVIKTKRFNDYIKKLFHQISRLFKSNFGK